jgi:pimeloyl-ACP methyl ester carboxylesterase
MAKKIILIHGLGGTNDGTWGGFPDFLRQDTDLDVDVVLCGYESPSILEIWKRGPSVLNIANGVLTEIRTRCDLENDEIVIAGHSLGGVVAKKVLLLLKNKGIPNKVGKVCFFDVPHDGSGYANAGKYVAFRNRPLKILARDSSELDDLNEQWVNSGLKDSLEILSVISANDDIVSSSSSKSIFREHEVETINGVDHRTIVKPESPESPAYIVFKRFILKKPLFHRYKNSASRDLNDWKRLERNHSYQYATDEQRDTDLKSLVNAFGMDRAAIRLTGASGLGKTRLLLEAIDMSENIDDPSVLIFNAPSYEKEIKECIRSMVEDRVDGLVIIENCDIDLHNQLAAEVNKLECSLTLVTVGYSDEQVDDSIHIPLSPLSNDAIKKILLPILVGMSPSEVDRVARYAEGYPLMATLITNQYQVEGRLLGSIGTSSVVRKLIDGGDDGTSDDEKAMLSACSLFDVFGTAGDAAGIEAKYIADNITGLGPQVFDRVLNKFTRRQIINRAGRYARVVPKPLALALASEWWDQTSHDRQKQLIDDLPESLMESFCTQATYLDSHSSVQRFSDKLFGGRSPFVQAEELLTSKGSRLFRAFVEVNQQTTSDALYYILSNCSHEKLLAIDGDTRRNLVWGLEKLCFHADSFGKSAWCLLLLASAENESWSNNASGMFAQLFRVNLSGTKATPSVRFDLLKRAMQLETPHIDMIVIKALEEAIGTSGGTRMIGAEYQGTNAPLEEWSPDKQQEVFDFWQQAFDLMLELFERGGDQKEQILTSLGYSIRGLVAKGRIEMLDAGISKVVSLNGCYWPEALVSIKHAFQYDSNGMQKDASDALHSWLELLNPEKAELPEKLKILLTSPPWEYQEDEAGRMIDVAAENAKALAVELSKNIEELFPHIDLLLIGEQKQSYAFGRQLALSLAEPERFLELSFNVLKDLEQADSRLILGFYSGMSQRSSALWQKNVDQLLSDAQLIFLYPDVICTGEIAQQHLDSLLELIRNGLVPPTSANVLSYGRVTEGISPAVIADFCLKLALLGEVEGWSALNVIYMYCFGNVGCIDELRELIKPLVTGVFLHKGGATAARNVHHWRGMAEKLLTVRDQEFAGELANQLVAASKRGLEHGDIWSETKPLLLKLMGDYSDTLWPIFGSAVVEADVMERYWLQQLLDRETSLANEMPSVLAVVPVADIINWCLAHPDSGPAFAARCLNIFDTVDGQKQPSNLFVAMLENFGTEQVATELGANIGTRGWSGSLVPYLESDKTALSPLLEHKDSKVRGWVKEHIAYIDKQIVEETARDEESGFRSH